MKNPRTFRIGGCTLAGGEVYSRCEQEYVESIYQYPPIFKCCRKKTARSLAGGDAAKNIRLATRPDSNRFCADVIKTEINGTQREMP